jgi:hypothetical protein
MERPSDYNYTRVLIVIAVLMPVGVGVVRHFAAINAPTMCARALEEYRARPAVLEKFPNEVRRECGLPVK